MNKIILILLLIVNVVYGWEINTHRAIDLKAIEKSSNLVSFARKTKLNNENYKNEYFNNYNMTYFNYILNGEKNGISNKRWKQTFNDTYYQSLIEAGAILEDALWSDARGYMLGADGRFNSHFYNAQKGGVRLTGTVGARTDAVTWATVGATLGSIKNEYSYIDALSYDENGGFRVLGSYMPKVSDVELSEKVVLHESGNEVYKRYILSTSVYLLGA